MFSVDWAIKKEFKIYNIDTERLKSIPPTEKAFSKFLDKLSNKDSFYIEEGGGDTFKLLALKHGHQVFTISGKKVKKLREKLDLPESDENSAIVIGLLAKEHPEQFYEYQKLDINVLKITLLYKEYCKVIEDSTRKKNQLYAFENRLRLLTSEKDVKKIVNKRKNTIKCLRKEISGVHGQLLKLVEEHPLWVNYLKDIKGVGPITTAGIIGSVRRFSRFPSKYSLRHFAGMIEKQENPEYNRHLKQALYNFVEGIIQKRTHPWRELYDKIKIYYKEKHPNWIPGKVNAYAKKFVQTKFLDKLWIERMKVKN